MPTDTKVRIDRIVRQMLMDIKYPEISERVKSYGVVTIVIDSLTAILSTFYILTIDKYNIRNFYISGKQAKLLLWSLVALGAFIQGVSSGPYVSLLLSHGTTGKENRFMRFVFSIADTLASVIILITKLDKVLANFKGLVNDIKNINHISKAVKAIYTVFKVFSIASSVLFESDDELRLAKEGFTLLAIGFSVLGTIFGAAAYIHRNEQFFKEYEEKIKNEISEKTIPDNLMKKLLAVFFASYIAKMAIITVSAIKKELGSNISVVNNLLSIAIAATAIYLMRKQINNNGKFGPLDQISVLFAGIGLVTAGIGILGSFYK